MNTYKIARLTLFMAAFWLLLSGYFKANLLILGLLSIIVTIIFIYRLEIDKYKSQPLLLPALPFLRYWCWLVLEIFKSNIAVAKLILNPKLPIKPLLKTVPRKQTTQVGRVLYASSITLTPGTVSINVNTPKGIMVHALHADSIAELEECEMHDKVMQVEKQFAAVANKSDN